MNPNGTMGILLQFDVSSCTQVITTKEGAYMRKFLTAKQRAVVQLRSTKNLQRGFHPLSVKSLSIAVFRIKSL